VPIKVEKSFENILFAKLNNDSVVDLVNYEYFPEPICVFSVIVIFENRSADLVTIVPSFFSASVSVETYSSNSATDD
jgi:hypothetical protein